MNQHDLEQVVANQYDRVYQAIRAFAVTKSYPLFAVEHFEDVVSSAWIELNFTVVRVVSERRRISLEEAGFLLWKKRAIYRLRTCFEIA